MTEKRFNIEYVHGNPTIWHITDCEEHIVNEKICDLLNELNDENEKLKSDRARYEEEYRLNIFQELSEENEQLKKELNHLRYRFTEYRNKKGDVE